MSALSPGFVFRISAMTWSASTRTPARSRCSTRARFRSTSRGSIAHGQEREAGRLSFTTDLPRRSRWRDAVFIAVGTPTRRGDGHADLTYVMAAAEEVARALTGYAVIVTKSTVPVGTNRKVKQAVAKANPRPSSTSPRTRNSCAKARRSTISCAPTAWSSASDRARRRGHGRDLPPALPARFPDHHHRSGIRRDDQIRRQRVPGDEDHLHQRDRRAVRARGRRREGSVQGHGLDGGSATSSCMPAPGYGGSCFPKDTSALARIGQEHAVPHAASSRRSSA
jgi:UDPglucose 6-dehydrogenase